MSDSLSSDYEDDTNWLLELETVLLENCDFFKLRSICRDRPIPGHLRQEVWKICLNINPQIDQLEQFNELFDLPNQDVLHDNCCEFVANLPKDLCSNSIGFINDIEVILTYFSRTYRVAYEPNNGWLSILRVLCVELRLNKRSDLYNYFSAISHRFIPSTSVLNEEIFAIFRLLLQYHDPELCSFMDTQRIGPETYSRHWFNSIFSSVVSLDALVQLWDVYFLIADPLLVFFLSLVAVLNLKDDLMELRTSPDTHSQSQIVSRIQSALESISAADIEDFVALSRQFVDNTPKSFSNKFSPILFGNAHKDREMEALLTSLCLPISIHELLESKTESNNSANHNTSIVTNNRFIRYFLIDCRPADQYNSGHLSSAYFLDSSLLISSPAEDFQTSISALLSTQQQALESRSQAAAGEHIALLGPGDHDPAEHDALLNMIIAQFLRRNTRFLSIVHGGYRAIHDVLGPHCDDYFTGHDSTRCRPCVSSSSISNYSHHHHHQIAPSNGVIQSSSQQPQQLLPSGDKSNQEKLFSKFSSVLKSNSTKLTNRFTTLVAGGKPSSNTTINDSNNRSISQNPKQIRTGKTYRNTANIFSIDDRDGDGIGLEVGGVEDIAMEHDDATAAPAAEMVSLDVWAARPDTLAVFACCVVDESGALHPAHLLLTRSHLFVLKRSASRFDSVSSLFQSNRSLETVIKGYDTTSGHRNNNIVSIYRRRLLSSVVKITSKKRLPECLTFHYLMTDGCTIEQDRYVIDQAGEAARIIKIQVQKMIDEESPPVAPIVPAVTGADAQ